MCGIVGIAGQNSIAHLEVLENMRDSMSHRGPDDAGVWWSSDRLVGLAHRRLAIIDLSSSGHQPMSDDSGRIWVTFNGEIYNYQDLRHELESYGYHFRSSSDTEVILQAYRAWGVNCLARLNGMFAFGLYDTQERQIFLARDRAGEKPLFYAHLQGKLVFASELKALMAYPSFPRFLDFESLNYYLAYGYVPGTRCMLKGVKKLAQGEAITYHLETDTLHSWQYWNLPKPSLLTDEPEEQLIEELELLLMESVRQQLVADVPVGILLSGGIDSSLVTAMAARVSSRPVKTFTISFPGHGNYNEGPYARMVAEHFGTEHTEMVAEPATIDLLPELARQFDEPMCDSSMVPTYLVSRLIRQHATVALGGDGGDELFGGYLHHSWGQQQESIQRFIPTAVRSALNGIAQTYLPVGLKGRNYLIGLGSNLRRSVSPNVLFDPLSRQKLLAPVTDNSSRTFLSSPEWYKMSKGTHGKTLLQQSTMIDFQTYLVDDILVKVDRASMLASLEVRAPWLDYRIIEFAFGRVPDNMKATVKERKILPKRLSQQILPRQLDLNRKQGFSLPLASWFKGKWGDYIADILQGVDTRLFNRRIIESLVSNQRRGLFSNTERLFALTIFELWRREYNITVGE